MTSSARRNRSLLLVALCLLGGAAWLAHERDRALPHAAWAGEEEEAEASEAGAGGALVLVHAGAGEASTAPSPAARQSLAEDGRPSAVAQTGGFSVVLVDDLDRPLCDVNFQLEWRPIRTQSGGFARSQKRPLSLRTDGEGRVQLPAEIQLLGGGIRLFGRPQTFGLGCTVGLREDGLRSAPEPGKLVIPRPVAVTGMVRSALPIEGVTVSFWPGGPEKHPLVTQADGAFTLAQVSPLARELRFQRSVTRATVALALAPDRTAASVWVDLHDGTWVRGVVLDLNGEPVPGTRVEYRPDFAAAEATRGAVWGAVDLKVSAGRRTTTDGQGRFVFGIPKACERIHLVAYAAEGSSQRVAVLDLEPPAGETIDVVLRETGTRWELRGVVRFRGDPLEEARVELLDDRDEVVGQTKTDGAGAYGSEIASAFTPRLRIYREPVLVDPEIEVGRRTYQSIGPLTTDPIERRAADNPLITEFPTGAVRIRLGSRSPSAQGYLGLVRKRDWNLKAQIAGPVARLDWMLQAGEWRCLGLDPGSYLVVASTGHSLKTLRRVQVSGGSETLVELD